MNEPSKLDSATFDGNALLVSATVGHGVTAVNTRVQARSKLKVSGSHNTEPPEEQKRCCEQGTWIDNMALPVKSGRILHMSYGTGSYPGFGIVDRFWGCTDQAARRVEGLAGLANPLAIP
jgi:hypothetical protein